MKKLLLSALAIAAVPAVALAEPQKLTDDQMDGVVAGLLNFFTIQANINATQQQAVAAGNSTNVCVIVACGGTTGSAAATNVNVTSQRNRN